MTEKKKPKKAVNNYMKYSGLAFQLAAYGVAGVWLGGKIDKYFGWDIPYASAFLPIFLIGTYLYKVVVILGKKDSAPPKK